MTDWFHEKIAPMLAGSGAPFDSERHLFEIKWDGIRILAFFDHGSVRLQGRKLLDATERYPEIVRGVEKLPARGVLDGEVVVLDDDGRPNFQRVLIREQTSTRDAAVLKATKHPVVYMAFDLIHFDGEPWFHRPLTERKKQLATLLRDAPSPLVESTYVTGQGRALFEQADARGLEGVVAKLRTSRYQPGDRSGDWLKLKVRRRTDAVLVGLVREHGTGRVKSLVLGVHDDAKTLVWLGNVGSGLDGPTIAQLSTELGPLKAASPPPAFGAEAPGTIDWLKPALVVRVEYSELTMDGRLRHPVFIGFVEKEPTACTPPAR